MDINIDDIEKLFIEYRKKMVNIPDEIIDTLAAGQVSTTDRIKTVAVYFHSLGQGGVQRVISLLTPMYVEMGYKVVLIAENENRDTDYEYPLEVKRYLIPRETDVERGDIAYGDRGRRLSEIFQNENIDVFCHHGATSRLLAYDMLVALRNGVKFVLVKHQIFSSEIVKGVNYYYLYKKLFKHMHMIVVLSHMEEKYWRRLGFRAVYIPNPVNENIGFSSNAEKDYILWEGRLENTQKNYLDIVPIVKIVAQEYPDIKCKIYGSGNPTDQKKLQSLIRRNYMQNNVEYCGFSSSLDEIYQGARIHLVTSDYEAFPMGIFEGKLYGIPLVTYDMPYLELLREKKGFISVEPGNIEKAAEAIIRILKNKALEDKLRKEARESALPFNNNIVKTRWKQAIEGLSEDAIPLTEKDDDFEMILDTIYHHAERRKKQLPEYVKILREGCRYLTDSLKYRIMSEDKGLIIFPYGEVGKMIKKLLEDNDISVDYICDNDVSIDDIYDDDIPEQDIITVKQLSKLEKDKYLVLICSRNREIYYDLRKEVYAVIDKNNVIDLYPWRG